MAWPWRVAVATGSGPGRQTWGWECWGRGGDTHVDHSIGRDAEEGGPLVHHLQLLPTLSRDLEAVQLRQRALERGTVLGDEVVARAQVVQFQGQVLQGVAQLALVSGGHSLVVVVPRVICRGGNGVA